MVSPDPQHKTSVIPEVELNLGWLVARMLIGSPRALAQVAWRCSTVQAASIGMVAFSVEGGIAGSAITTPLAEPFRSLSHYLFEILKLVPLTATFMIPIGLLLMGFLFVLAGWRRLALGVVMSRVSQCQMRVLLMGHVGLFFPILVWSVFSALYAANNPTFGLGGPASKPAWLGSPIIAFFGHRLWMAGFVVLPIVSWALAFRRLKDLHPLGDVPQCRTCDYILLGLTEPRCPECGTPFDPKVLETGGGSNAR